MPTHPTQVSGLISLPNATSRIPDFPSRRIPSSRPKPWPSFVLLALALLAVFVPDLRAFSILETGPDYQVVSYETGDPAGTVVMKIEYPVWDSNQWKVRTTLLDVDALPGWTFDIRSAGGMNGWVEIRFRNGKKSLLFKVRYVPGKTYSDAGTIR